MFRRLSALIVLLLALTPIAAGAVEIIPVPLDGTPVEGVVRGKYTYQNYERYRIIADDYMRVKLSIRTRDGNAAGTLYIGQGDEEPTQVNNYTWQSRWFNLDLSPGTHYLYIMTGYLGGIPIVMRAVSQPLAGTPRDNTTPEKALPLAVDKTEEGYACINERYYYTFTLDSDSDVKLTATLRDTAYMLGRNLPVFNMRVYDENGDEVNLLSKIVHDTDPTVTENTASLSAGRYTMFVSGVGVYLRETYPGATGPFSLKLSVLGPSSVSCSLDAKAIPSSLLAGQTRDVSLSRSTQYSSKPLVTWSSSNSEVLSVKASEDDPATCALTALSPGKATVTATAGDFSASKRVSVRANRFALKRPKAKKKPGVYAAHKSMEYQDGFIRCEVYLINRSSAPLTSLDGVQGVIMDMVDGEVFARAGLNPAHPGLPLLPGKMTTISFKVPQDSMRFVNLNSVRYIKAALTAFETTDEGEKSAKKRLLLAASRDILYQ